MSSKGSEVKRDQQEVRALRVGAVQVERQPDQVAANHAHALSFIETAVAQGAYLVILPELFASGYIPSRSI